MSQNRPNRLFFFVQQCSSKGKFPKHFLLPQSSLLRIYTSFVRPHLNYCNVSYNQTNNSSFSDKIESVQYNTVITITKSIRTTSIQDLYQELGLESLRSSRWLRRMSYSYKIISNELPL